VPAVLEASANRLLTELSEDALVLDVGSWGKPFTRADWVLDLMPYETRGLYGRDGPDPERFTADTWVRRDMCAREPWPFADDQFDFAICSHTLEDVRDPLWVCSELVRVAKAGYIEVPSRLEEQSYGFQGPWVGWGHHHWLIDVGEDRIDFVFKHHVIHGQPQAQFGQETHAGLTSEQRVQSLWWSGSFDYAERVLMSAEEVDTHLAEFVGRNAQVGPARTASGDPPLRRVARRLKRAVR
jgi:hypothetical protein